MGVRSSLLLRHRLVDHLRRQGLLRDPRIVRAFLDVPRELFLPRIAAEEGLAAVYRDDAIVIRRDPVTGAALSSSSQPAIMAIMLEMLRPQPGHRLMEIGVGSGYNAALLGRLAGPEGFVVSVDIDAGTARAAAVALRSLGSGVRLVVADGAQGLPGIRGSRTRMHGMVVTASTAVIPRWWHLQLADGGRLVVPLRLSRELERAHAVAGFERVPDGFDSFAVTPGGFMPLRRHDGSAHSPPGAAGERAADDAAGERAADDAAGDDVPGPATSGEDAAGAEATAAEPVPAWVGVGATDREGSPSTIARDEMDRLVIAVRYGPVPPPARWRLRRGDHWIGIDVAGERDPGHPRHR